MIVQGIYLEPWDWEVYAFYDTRKSDAETVLTVLETLGCSGRNLRKATGNLLLGAKNTGLTYSSTADRASVVVVSKSTSPAQFWNTFDHEKGHVVRHIASALDIDDTAEEYQYLAGMLAEKMYPIASGFICDCANFWA